MNIDECIRELKLHRILRYVLSGIFSIISYLSFSSNSISNIVKSLRDNLIVILLISLFVGISIYVIHRAILYAIFGRLSLGLAKRWPKLPDKVFSLKWWLYLHRPTQCEVELDRERWGRRGDIQNDLDEWGGQIHFMYCSAWAILFGNLLARIMYIGAVEWNIIITVFFFVFLLGAFVSNCRGWYHEIDLKNNPIKGHK